MVLEGSNMKAVAGPNYGSNQIQNPFLKFVGKIWAEDGPNFAKAFQPRRALAKQICFLYFLPVIAREYHPKKQKKSYKQSVFQNTPPKKQTKKPCWVNWPSNWTKNMGAALYKDRRLDSSLRLQEEQKALLYPGFINAQIPPLLSSQ